jgi:hypothetical protein
VLLAALAIVACGGGGRSSPSSARIELQVTPPAPREGPAELAIRLSDRGGAPISGASVNVEADMGHGMAPLAIPAREVGPGRYAVPDFTFSMDGEWVLTVRAALPGGERVEDAFKIPVTPR